MAQKSKLEKEYQVEEDGTTVVPKELLPQIAPTVLKNTVKRERTEAQKANFDKVVQANKERWAKIREEKEASMAQAKQAIKDDHKAKVEAGTHVRVAVKEKRVQKPKEVVVEESSEEEEVIIVKKPKEKVKEVERESERVPTLRKPVISGKGVGTSPDPLGTHTAKPSKPLKKRVVYETETETETETDSDDTDYEDYKSGKRQIRREVKKNIKAIEKIDNVVQQTIVNPYSALLASRWK
jgi:hypothetical protein